MSNNINFLKKKTVLNDILSNRNVSVINNTKYDPNDENDKGLLLNTINNAETNTDKYIISYDNVDLNISYNDIKELYRSKSWLSNNQVSFDEFKDNVNYYNNYNKNGIQDLTYVKYDQSLNTNTLLIDNTYNSLYYVRPDKINLMSYSIKNTDGFNYDENNHILKFNIDNNYIKSINNLLYYNYNNIRNTSSDKTGIASIDDKFFDVKNYNNSYSNNILTINKEFKTEIYSTLNKIKNLYNDCKVIYNKEKTSQTITENGENNKIGGININNTEIRFEDPKLYYDDDVVGVNSLDLANADTLYVFDLDNADFRLGYTDTLDYDYKENQYTSNASANSLSNDVKNSTLKNRISLTLSENDASANIIANQHIKSNHVIGTTYNINLGDVSKNSFNANGLSILYKASPYKISTENSGQLITIPYDKELNIRKIAGTFGKYFYTTEIERIAEYLFVSSHYDIKGFRIPDSSFDYLKSRNTITDIFNLQYYSVLKAGYGYPEVYPILNLYPNNYINEKYFDSDLISYYENNDTAYSEIIATEDELSTCVSKIRDVYLDDVKCLYFYKLLHKDGYYETVGEPNMLIFEEDIDSCLTFIARNDVQFTFTVPVGCEDNAKYIQFSLDGVTWEYLIDNTIKKDNNDKIIDKGVIYKKYTYINNLNDSNNGKIRSESNIKIIKTNNENLTNNFEYSKIENKNEYIYRGENGFGDNQPDNIKYIIQTTNNITYITIASINNLIINLQNELRNDPENNEKIEKLDKLNNALNDGFIYEKTEKNQYNIIINETFIKDFNEHIENINDENVVTYNSILHNDITHITYTLNHTIENSNKILWRAKFYNFKLSDDHKYIEDIKDNNDNLSINDKPYYIYPQYDYITANPNLANGIGIFGAICSNGDPKFEIFGNSMSLIYGCPYIEYVDEISNEKTNVYCTKLSDKPHIFDKLFSGSYIVSAKRLALPATSLEKSNFCYQEMFLNCDHLTDSPKLPAEILADRCYKGMFKNCIGLQSAPRLDALTMKPECYKEMFRGCKALLMPPNVTKKYPTGIFMSKELAYGCYESMFEGCKNLRVMPQLTASKMKENCYKKMFKDCGQIGKAVNLPVIQEFAKSCFYFMFYKTQIVPHIVTSGLKINLCEGLYFNAKNNNEQEKFVNNVRIGALQGIFGGTNIEYIELAKFLPKDKHNNAYLNTYLNETYNNLDVECYLDMFYNAVLLDKAPYIPATEMKKGCYYRMFYGCSSLQYIPEFTINTSAEECCYQMFYEAGTKVNNYLTFRNSGFVDSNNDSQNTISLSLSNNTDILSKKCYYQMFYGCDKLYDYNLEDQTIQVITTIGGISCEEQSCESMFEGCANIKYTTSSLPSTTLAEASYKNMYKNCSALIDGPQINAQILANQCCMSMFEGCTLLTNTTSSLPATILKDECYKNMYKNCRSLSVAPSIDNPENTTTLAEECCMSMFEGCRALIKSPDLSATKLVENCYERMFYGCENLIFIKALFLTAPMNKFGVENPVGDENPAFATDDWVYGVKNFDEKNNNNLIDSFEDYNEKYSHQSQQQIQFTDNLINAIKNRADDDNDSVLDNDYVDVNNENGVLGLFIRNKNATWIVKENIGVDGIPKYWNVYSSEGAKEYPVFVFFHSDSYRNYEDYSKLIYGFPGDNYGDDVPNSNMFPRRGYSFSGWSNLKNSNNADFTSITIKNQKFIEDKQYWAVWNANTYDIYWYYNLENRLYDTTSGAYDTLISDHKPNPMLDINSPIPTHHYPYADGYIFWCWSSIQNPQEQLGYVNRNTPTDYFMRPIDINGPGYDPNIDNIDNDPETFKRETNTVGIDIEDENNFYAVWKYIVKWNANGGKYSGNNSDRTNDYFYQTYFYNDQLEDFPDSNQEPTSINDTLYKFGGWATSSTIYIPDMYTDSIDYDAMKLDISNGYWRPTSQKSYNIIEPKNYYATWEYRMLWYRLPNDLYVTNYGYYNDSVKNYQPAYPLRTGYTPKGWNTSAGQTIENISSRNVDNNTDNNIFYVVWEANECTIYWYWYKFEGDQDYYTTSGAYDSLVTDHLPGNDDLPSETGYEFIGWNTSPLATEDNITGVTVKESNDNNFYAVWWYIVTWNYGNHSSDHPDTTSKFKYNDNIILPTESTNEDNCTFIGWYTQQDSITINGTGTQITNSTKVTSPVTYYARYQCTITFNYNGGSGSTNSETIECGASLGNKLPTNPSRANYTFNGWRTTQDGIVRVLPATKFTSHTTIYAAWAVNSHTITFNYTNGYSGDELSRPVTAGDPIGTLPTGTKEGYYDSNTWQYNGTVIDSTFTMPDSDITLTLVEGGPIPYTITFNYTDGYSGDEPSRTVYYGNQIKYLTSGEEKDLPTGTREGYNPSNTWKYEDGTTIAKLTDTMPAHDIILTLVESDPIQYGIIFKLGDSNYTYINSSGITIISANPNYGTTLGNAVNPWPTAGGSPQYHNSSRWKKEGTDDEVDSNTPVQGSMTLVPINGDLIEYRVTFNLTNGYESLSISPNYYERHYNEEIGTLPIASGNSQYQDTSEWEENNSPVYSTTRVYRNMVLTPKRGGALQYTVTWMSNYDGGPTLAPSPVTAGQSVNAPDISRTGYNTPTWNTDQYGNGTTISFPFYPTSDITLYAQWSETPIYTITFIENRPNGSTITRNVEQGQPLPLANIPTVTWDNDHPFMCWNKEKNGIAGSENVLNLNNTYTPTGNDTWYAQWIYDWFYIEFNSSPTEHGDMYFLDNVNNRNLQWMRISYENGSLVDDNYWAFDSTLTDETNIKKHHVGYIATTGSSHKIRFYLRNNPDDIPDYGNDLTSFNPRNYITTSNGSGVFTYDGSSSITFTIGGNPLSLIFGNRFEEVDISDFGGYSIDYIFKKMFSGLTRLSDASQLKLSSKMSGYAYEEMFKECTSLSAAPSLPATTLYGYCYQSMFEGCTSLVTAPTLPAPTLKINCYCKMFYNCASLNSITCYATNITADNCLYQWVGGNHHYDTNNVYYGVQQYGEFHPHSDMINTWSSSTYKYSNSGVPYEWTIEGLVIHTITFNINYTGGESIDPITRTHNEEYGTLPSPSRIGYTFIEWNTESDGSGDGIESTDHVTSDITLYAQWSINTYTVKFIVTDTKYEYISTDDGNYGVLAMQGVAPGTTLGELLNDNELPEAVDTDNMYWPSRRWKIKDTDTEVTIQYAVTSNIILVPILGDPKYTITYHYRYYENNELKTGTDSTRPNNAVTLPSPTRDCFIFGGWYTNTDFTGDALTGSYTPSENVDLYAKWTLKDYFKTTTIDAANSTNGYTTHIAPNISGYWYDLQYAILDSDYNNEGWEPTWYNYANGENNISYFRKSWNQNTTIMWRATAEPGRSNRMGSFELYNGYWKISGHITSLLMNNDFYNNGEYNESIANYPNRFNSFFAESCTADGLGGVSGGLKLADELILPSSTTIACYINMFENCKALISAPSLPARTLSPNCYDSMFKGCSLLAVAPSLPATTLECSGNNNAYQCYANMFEDCTALTEAPSLPATTLAPACYYKMFKGCTSLTTPPYYNDDYVLPATTLPEWSEPVEGLSSYDGCYQSMFEGCTALTTSPVLPAETLVENCYKRMFYNCNSLTTIICLAIFSAGQDTNYCDGWVGGTGANNTDEFGTEYGVPYSGIFYKNSDMSNWHLYDIYSVPWEWHVRNYGATTYTVTWNAGGGLFEVLADNFSEDLVYDENNNLIGFSTQVSGEIPIPSWTGDDGMDSYKFYRTGYSFVDWYDSPAEPLQQEQDDWADDDPIQSGTIASGNKTYYARWRVNSKPNLVLFDDLENQPLNAEISPLTDQESSVDVHVITDYGYANGVANDGKYLIANVSVTSGDALISPSNEEGSGPSGAWSQSLSGIYIFEDVVYSQSTVVPDEPGTGDDSEQYDEEEHHIGIKMFWIKTPNSYNSTSNISVEIIGASGTTNGVSDLTTFRNNYELTTQFSITTRSSSGGGTPGGDPIEEDEEEEANITMIAGRSSDDRSILVRITNDGDQTYSNCLVTLNNLSGTVLTSQYTDIPPSDSTNVWFIGTYTNAVIAHLYNGNTELGNATIAITI